MIPIDQSERRDCLRACLASIMEMRIEDVPHFQALYGDHPQRAQAIQQWCRTHGVEAVCLGITSDLDEFLRTMGAFNPNAVYIVSGGAGDPELGHAVVAVGGRLVHDPAMAPAGIDGPVQFRNGPVPSGGNILHNVILFGGVPPPMQPKRLPRDRPPVDLSPILQHEKTLLLLSGGKDSIALLELVREAGLLDRVTVGHVDSGDLPEETQKLVASIERHVPNFVRKTSDVRGWIAANATPSDLVPKSGMIFPTNKVERPVCSMFACCDANRWAPMAKIIKETGATLLLCGQRHDDPVRTMHNAQAEGVTRIDPIAAWTDGDVFDYLQERGVELPPWYLWQGQGPECMRCPASWGERRAKYLKLRHPEKAAEYAAHLQQHLAQIQPHLAELLSELRDLGVAPGTPSSPHRQ